MRAAWKSCLTACVAVLVVSSSQPANADPFITPSASDIVGVGSETMQFLINDLADAYNYGPSNPIDKVYYWDATGSPTIIPKANTPEITRPNGSTTGIAAMQNNRSIDFAGSTRGRKTGDTALLFIPVAEDTVRYALSAQVPSYGMDGLTWAALTSIYTCSITNWSQVGGPNATIQPLLPPYGSGTRDYFLNQLGLSTVGPCVTNAQVNDPAPIQTNPNAIAPFSVARSTYPVNQTGNIKLNTTGFIGYRPIYFVVRDAGGSTVPNNMQPLVGDGTAFNTAFICSPAGQAIVTRDGFVALPGHTASMCGVAE